MCEVPVLVSRQAVDLIEVITYENVAANHACMKFEGTVDIYPGNSLYINHANLPKVNIDLS